MADMPIIHHAVAHAAIAKPIIFHGVSYMTAIISSIVSAGISFGLGWYIKGRGMTGVKIDLNNIKTDVENLKAKISAQVPVQTV